MTSQNELMKSLEDAQAFEKISISYSFALQSWLQSERDKEILKAKQEQIQKLRKNDIFSKFKLSFKFNNDCRSLLQAN